ncbi:MAG: DeoR/GlpR family DNA-binding transcription regulator [Pseudorhodobacter sp.]|nr:DeoR/GlpR family DNA-binding transcription regulator [Pseudorhodobacter sp.]
MTRIESRLGKTARQACIMDVLAATPSLRVNDLALRLAVSTETVRRDLAELSEVGKISRTYGGATRLVQHEPGVAVRETLMPIERARIAEAAVQLVESGEILAIGGGATTLHFARKLAVARDHLTVITHAFSIAAALVVNATHKVLMLPGQYDGREGLIHGPDTIDALQKFHTNKAFLGASGLTAEGPSDAGLGPGFVYGAMMRRTSKSFILADHSKFENPSLTVYGTWGPATTLITDAPPSGGLAAALAEAGVAVVIAAARPGP